MSRLAKFSLIAVLSLAVVLLVGITPTPTLAGHPHFVDVSATRSGNTITVCFKEAGLGNEPQVHVVATVSAECINPGEHHPKAANKESFSAAGDFPVQNGKAEGCLTVTVTFQPDCTPPMSLILSDIVVTDTTSGISESLPGTF